MNGRAGLLLVWIALLAALLLLYFYPTSCHNLPSWECIGTLTAESEWEAE